jgi:hypothetical protein
LEASGAKQRGAGGAQKAGSEEAAFQRPSTGTGGGRCFKCRPALLGSFSTVQIDLGGGPDRVLTVQGRGVHSSSSFRWYPSPNPNRIPQWASFILGRERNLVRRSSAMQKPVKAKRLQGDRWRPGPHSNLLPPLCEPTALTGNRISDRRHATGKGWQRRGGAEGGVDGARRRRLRIKVRVRIAWEAATAIEAFGGGRGPAVGGGMTVAPPESQAYSERRVRSWTRGGEPEAGMRRRKTSSFANPVGPCGFNASRSKSSTGVWTESQGSQAKSYCRRGHDENYQCISFSNLLYFCSREQSTQLHKPKCQY